MRTNSRFYPKFLTGQRILVLVLAVLVTTGVGILLSRPAPTTAEIVQAINGPVKFERPSAMEYVVKTNSCIVGGTVVSIKWHVGNKNETVNVGEVNSNTVEYTSFGFRADDGRVFAVSHNGALYTEAGENLGLELECDPVTMNTAPSFGMVRIIYGGK